MASADKASSYWFLGRPVQDVISMSILADVEGVMRPTHTLFVTLPAFDEIDDIAGLAGGHGMWVVVYT